MMIVFRVDRAFPGIVKRMEAVEVTPKSVVFASNIPNRFTRVRKETFFTRYYESFARARQCALVDLEKKLRAVTNQAELYQGLLDRLTELKETDI